MGIFLQEQKIKTQNIQDYMIKVKQKCGIFVEYQNCPFYRR